jgi:hypothetical protein
MNAPADCRRWLGLWEVLLALPFLRMEGEAFLVGVSQIGIVLAGFAGLVRDLSRSRPLESGRVGLAELDTLATAIGSA